MDSRHNICPLCQSTSLTSFMEVFIEESIHGIGSYDLCGCDECGFVFANTKASKDDYRHYYESFNRYSNIPNQSASSLVTYEAVRHLFYNYFPKTTHIIDVGCGPGEMLSLMKADGYTNLCGLDPSAASIAKLNSAGLTGIHASIGDEITQLEGHTFEAAIISGVLEHLFDPSQAIDSIFNLLKPNGTVICIVPDLESYSTYAYPLAHYVNIEHINHFTSATLVELFTRHGFMSVNVIRHTIDFGTKPDPAITAIFRKSTRKDTAFVAMQSYLSKNNYHQLAILKVLEKVRETGKPIVVFGAGNFSKSLFAIPYFSKLPIQYFIDNDKSLYSTKIHNHSILAPITIKEFSGTVLICSMQNHDEMRKQLLELNSKIDIVILCEGFI